MGMLQKIYTIENYESSSFVIPSKMRQKLYCIQANLNASILNEDIMVILEGEVERMFVSVDELEKVMNKLDCQAANISGDENATTMMKAIDNDYYNDIYQDVICLIKGMEENMDRLERIMEKSVADPHPQHHHHHVQQVR